MLCLQVLDAFHHGSVDGYPSVKAITAESKQLQEFQELFEMYVSDYLVLTRCGEELLHLKSLWDMVSWGCWWARHGMIAHLATSTSRTRIGYRRSCSAAPG
jgi:hypothetical protein